MLKVYALIRTENRELNGEDEWITKSYTNRIAAEEDFNYACKSLLDYGAECILETSATIQITVTRIEKYFKLDFAYDDNRFDLGRLRSTSIQLKEIEVA